jgi:two-component system sensor histidine kinase/response regulator
MNNMNDEAQSIILIVDDNPQNLQVLGNILRAYEYKPALAKSGFQALEFVQKRQPDCILLDILMPEMDGFETCRLLKAQEITRDIPVIFITGVTDPWNKAHAFEAGGVDYIVKPFQQEEVLLRVKAHLSLRLTQKQLQAQNSQLRQEILKREQAEAALQATHDELQAKNAELQYVNAGKDKFFSILSHDLRNSFGVLRTYAELLTTDFDTYSPENLKANIEVLRATANKLYTLLENLLTWSRLQRGVMEWQPHEFDLKEIAGENMFLFSSKAEQKQVLLTHTIPLNTWVYADHHMIRTVLRNLISNALKFTNAGDAIEVFAAQVDDKVEVAVADTGIGIPQDALAKLFQIENKYSQKGTAGEEGTGLGLILCQELVKQNGGAIWVESEEGKGATVKFTLPMSRSHQTT